MLLNTHEQKKFISITIWLPNYIFKTIPLNSKLMATGNRKQISDTYLQSQQVKNWKGFIFERCKCQHTLLSCYGDKIVACLFEVPVVQIFELNRNINGPGELPGVIISNGQTFTGKSNTSIYNEITNQLFFQKEMSFLN